MKHVHWFYFNGVSFHIYDPSELAPTVALKIRPGMASSSRRKLQLHSPLILVRIRPLCLALACDDDATHSRLIVREIYVLARSIELPLLCFLRKVPPRPSQHLSYFCPLPPSDPILEIPYTIAPRTQDTRMNLRFIQFHVHKCREHAEAVGLHLDGAWHTCTA